MTKLKLHWQIIICMIVGTIIGMIINTNHMQDSALYTIAVLLADIFVRLLKMVIVPLIFTSIITYVKQSNSTKTAFTKLNTQIINATNFPNAFYIAITKIIN